MSEIVKICKIHGELTKEYVLERMGIGKIGYRCKICRQEQAVLREVNPAIYKCKRHGEVKKDDYYFQGTTFRCRLCNRESAATSKRNRREEVNAWTRKNRKDKPHIYRDQKKRHVEKYGKDIMNEYEVCRRVNLNVDEYRKIIIEQDKKCLICGKEETKISRNGRACRLSIDHDHATMKIRGLLCHNCNTGIGKFFDSVDLMEKAIDYLKRHQDGQPGKPEIQGYTT